MNAKRFVLLFIAVLLTLLAGSTTQAAPPEQDIDIRLSADEFTIVRGQCTVLRWRTTNATRVELEEEPSNYAGGSVVVPDPNMRGRAVVLSGEEKICPSTTTTYFIIVVNARGKIMPATGLTIAVVDTPVSPVAPVVPVQPVVPGVGQCSEGFAYAPDYFPGIEVYAAEDVHLECTDYIRTLPQWKNLITWSGNAHEWDEGARDAHTVVDQNPREGDIVVWERGCGKASKTYGHVAYVKKVPDSNHIIVNEANWRRADGTYDGQIHERIPYEVDRSCMSFIHPMSGPTQQPQSSPSIDKCSQYAWWDPRGWWCRIFGQ